MTTFLDTNILIDLLSLDSPFHSKAVEACEKRREEGPLVICDIVYSEFSAGMANRQSVDEAIQMLSLERLHFSNAALFQAGQAFKQYRTKKDSNKMNVLSDFLIGAIAESEEVPLLTRNAKDYKNYFPGVKLIITDP
jgi:predicted nucleic acid-binding protein